MAMLNALVAAAKEVASGVQSQLAQQSPSLANELDLPQRIRFAELVARGFNTFVHGLVRATKDADTTAAAAAGPIRLGPSPATTASTNSSGASDDADDEAFAKKFAAVFLDMGGIFPKLAQVLSMRSDLIKNEIILRRLRTVQEECRRRPVHEEEQLVKSESAPFREGRFKLREFPSYMHAGSVAQVAPYVVSRDHADGGDEDESPDGVVKMTFEEAREQMAIDFRLLRSQLKLMEKTGQLTRGMQSPGLPGLSLEHMRVLQEVWNVIVGMEAEVLQEFNLQHEARCQEHGAFVLESLLGSGPAEHEWLEEWRNTALLTVLRPVGPDLASRAQASWSGGHAAAPAGWLTRMARRAVGGRQVAQDMAEGEESIARLRTALQQLDVRVPHILTEACGPHVLVMELAEGRSLKQVLDVALQEQSTGRGEADSPAQKAAAWFAALLLFVIIPLWGKMLLTLGCCHADPHPGNFKVSGIPGLEESMPLPMPPPKQPGLLRRLTGGAPAAQAAEAPLPLTLWVLDWGSCVDLGDDMRQSLCRLVIGLSVIRRAQRSRDGGQEDAAAVAGEADATRDVAAAVRSLGVRVGEDRPDRDAFQAALGMVLFDPAVASRHPLLRETASDELGRNLPVDSTLGRVLRVVAIMVGVCREMEARINEQAAERAPARIGDRGSDRPFVELFLVELWRPFAEEGLDM